MGLKDYISELKKTLNITDVISSYVSIQKSGKNYKALCPFHNEKTPSFYIYENTQSYHCFGCGANGDAIEFIQGMENCSFSEALTILADEAGMQPPDFSANSNPELIRYSDDMKQIGELFVNNLKENTPAWNYLKKKRDLDPVRCREYGLGWSTRSDTLRMKERLTVERLRELGMMNRYDKNMFSERLIIPLKDRYGRLLGFSGRSLQDGEDQPKYINSPQSEFFNKSELLFLLDRAGEQIRQVDFAIIVEGYMDALRLHLNGIKNTVAVMGTALTKRHVDKLSSLTRKFVFVFDSDEAGKKAVISSFNQLKDGINALVCELSGAKDPDEFLRKKGIDAFRRSLLKAVSIEEYILDHIKTKYDLTREMGKDRFVKESRYLLARARKMKNLSLFEKLIGRLSELTGIDKKLLMESWNRIKTGQSHPATRGGGTGNSVQYDIQSEKLNPEDELLILYLFHPTTRKDIEEIFEQYGDLAMENYQRFFKSVRVDFEPDDSTEHLPNFFEKQKIERFFRQFRRYDSPENFPRIISDCQKMMRKRHLKRELKKIDLKMKEEKDDQTKAKLLTERLRLSKEINQLANFERRPLDGRKQP